MMVLVRHASLVLIAAQCCGWLGGAVAMPARAAAGEKPLIVALHPAEDSRTILAQSQAMIDQLSQRLGMPVKAFVATDYAGIIEALRAKRTDLAYLGPFPYVLARTVADVEAFAVAESKKAGRVSYHSLIISRRGSGITTPADLKARTFAFTDPSSTSGHLFPKAGLLRLGLDPARDFGRVLFSGSHDAGALAVASGKVDAAAIADVILAQLGARGVVKLEEITTVWRSAAIPESPFVWRNDLPADLKRRVRAAVLEIKDIEWAHHGPINGFRPVDDDAYAVIRETAAVLNLDLLRMK